MITNVIDIKGDCSEAVDRAAERILADDLVAFPTDTVYGLGGALKNEVLAKIYEVKNRPRTMPIAVLFDSRKRIKEYCRKLDDRTAFVAKKFWPGPLTIVLRMKHKHNSLFRSFPEKTIAARIPDNRFVLDLIKKIDAPLAASSANLSGMTAAIRPEEVASAFLGILPLIVSCETTSLAKESTVIKFVEGKLVMIREGALKREEIEEALAEFDEINLPAKNSREETP